ncbi:hypothetical protein ACLOJK_003355 [Asimina triloba]
MGGGDLWRAQQNREQLNTFLDLVQEKHAQKRTILLQRLKFFSKRAREQKARGGSDETGLKTIKEDEAVI